jgi:hypothetical protein
MTNDDPTAAGSGIPTPPSTIPLPSSPPFQDSFPFPIPPLSAIEKTFHKVTVDHLCFRWKLLDLSPPDTPEGLADWHRVENQLLGGWFWRDDEAAVELIFLSDLLVTKRSLITGKFTQEAEARSVTWKREWQEGEKE